MIQEQTQMLKETYLVGDIKSKWKLVKSCQRSDIEYFDEKKIQFVKREKINWNCDTKNDVTCATICKSSRDYWILNYVCSFHMCVNKDFFNK